MGFPIGGTVRALCCLFGFLAPWAGAWAGVAGEHALSTEAAYVINSLVLIMSAAMVMWMAGGFSMLEAGMVSNRSTAIICLKNVCLYAISCLCFYVVGYNLMFTEVGSYVGSFSFLADMGKLEWGAVLGKLDEASLTGFLTNGDSYSPMAFLFFQSTFVATASSVVSGALAERIKLWPFFVMVLILSTVIYPIQGAWVWGGGWLAEMGFRDFAGSTVVHSVGGWVALTGMFFLGPRSRKYAPDGSTHNIFPSSVPLVALGVFVLWLGWFGFNGGSVVTAGGVTGASRMSLVLMNTNIAAAAGVLVALVVGRVLFRRVNILLILNGALAGLVAITAGPEYSQPLHAALVGGIGSGLSMLSYPLLDKFKLDDVVGAVPVHLVAGVWGTLAVGIWGGDGASLGVQLVGVLAIGAFVVTLSALVWFVLKQAMGIRVSEDVEALGQDLLELGIEEDVDPLISGTPLHNA